MITSSPLKDDGCTIGMQISETQEGRIYIYLVHLVVLKSEGDIDMIVGIGIRDQTLNPPSLDLVA